MTFRPFREEDLGLLYRSFVDAFSNYRVPVHLPFGAFRTRILHKLHIDPSLSMLATDASRCLGFVLHTTGKHEGVLTAYNGGTGVIPGARHNGLTLQLYDALLPGLAAARIKKILLEVITTNTPAIRIYEKMGFVYRQTYRCYKRPEVRTADRAIRPNPGLLIRQVSGPDFDRYAAATDIRPSFIDQREHLVHNLPNETILEAYLEGQWAGYVIYQPHLGRLSQLGVAPVSRGRGIATALIEQVGLLSQKKELTVINVPEEYTPMHDFLIAAGFVNEVEQYEMERII